MEIKYNKEYLELIKAFIPHAKDEGYFLSMNENNFHLNLYGEEHSVRRNVDVFPNSIKNHIKYHLYNILMEVTGKTLEWGILIGIRPLKLVRSLITEYGIDDGTKILIMDYLLSKRKIDLAIEIINIQEAILQKFSGGYSLYLDIPFCPSICNYCSFPTFIPTEDRITAYLKSLFKEMDKTREFFKGSPTSIYIGGGTPSAIGEKYLGEVIDKALQYFGRPVEFTVEIGRPDTINFGLLLMLKEKGIDRISINPQSMKDETLKLIGRQHDVKDTIDSYKMAMNMGFKDINMDLILGLPGENADDFKKTLESIEKLNPSSISIHSLAVKKGSKIHDENYENIEDDNFEKIRDEFIGRNSYIPYYLYRQKNIMLNIENIGYSKKGYESIYNILMMEDAQTILGLGLGASTKIVGVGRFQRHINTKDLKQYLGYSEEQIEDKLKYLKEQLHDA